MKGEKDVTREIFHKKINILFSENYNFVAKRNIISHIVNNIDKCLIGLICRSKITTIPPKPIVGLVRAIF